MSITVKKLISELDKIENKFLEVEIYSINNKNMLCEIESVRKVDRKVLIFTQDHTK